MKIELPDPADDPNTYRDTLLSVIGDRDPLEILATTVDRLRSLIAGSDPEMLQQRPSHRRAARSLCGRNQIADDAMETGPSIPHYGKERCGACTR